MAETQVKSTSLNETISKEVAVRRTFAIISHPDAGKTTLTEKLLLYGGAIHEAGSIKQRKAARHAASDWMAIEQERGISVTSSVLRFEKDGIKYNLLDTPGHKDFSEDTLRTLIAADCALMVIDVAKGVEEQTEKLFEVCKMRNIPVITFVNKCDRPGMEPLEVMSNIESKLGIRAVPASWPLGYGSDFQGVYDLIGSEMHLYVKASHGAKKAETEVLGLHDGLKSTTLTETDKEAWSEIIELISGDFHTMNATDFQNGKVTPVFFGSALNNFGLDMFLNYFKNLAPTPRPYTDTATGEVPLDSDFSGFVFKMQANMNPDHRDCTAFVRIASGVFKRGMEVQIDNQPRKIRMTTPHSLMGDERNLLETAYPGDIVALFNPGTFRIGSTLFEKDALSYDVIPLFSPEHFMKATSKDPFKRKQLREGLQQLAQEGVVHVFEVPNGVGNEMLLGTVGVLQFEVVQHRMKFEYKVDITMSPVPYHTARWLPGDQAVIDKLSKAYNTHVTNDMDGNPIVLFDSAYALNQGIEAVGEHNLFKFKT
ncbi:MAG: peptide chain release factor 3 [Balneolaceae bacterium]|nr:MAG: peptide chain release factor 3 [Balneolaceae bacterium]